MTEKARGWSSFSGTISATIVRMMPTLPLPAPRRARTVMAMARLVDMPQTTKPTMVLQRPQMRMGLRPKRSAALPQGTAEAAWAREKVAAVRPAHLATWFCSTPKSAIISGR